MTMNARDAQRQEMTATNAERVKQECEAHERNDDEFLDELFRQVADRALDQLRRS